MRKDHTSYINPDARDQFAAEGLIIGVLNLACAAALILVNTRAFDGSATAAGASGSGSAKGSAAKLSPVQHLLNALSPFFSPVVCFALVITLWHRIIAIYSMSTHMHTHMRRQPAERSGTAHWRRLLHSPLSSVWSVHSCSLRCSSCVWCALCALGAVSKNPGYRMGFVWRF